MHREVVGELNPLEYPDPLILFLWLEDFGQIRFQSSIKPFHKTCDMG